MDPTPLICRACGARPESAAEGDRCPNGDSFLITADVASRHPLDPVLGHAINGEYVLVDVLGSGGFGTVYRAIERTLGRTVAVKILQPHRSVSDDLRTRFEREARAIASLRHAAVVDVYCSGECASLEPGKPRILFMVLEYIEGPTLKALIRERGRLSVTEVVSIVTPLLDALAEAHRLGIVHRDLKPANIMLASDSGRPSVRVLDFGIAKILDDEEYEGLTGTGIIMGTDRYMSPEQIQGEPIDQRTDLYSVGVILYEMLAGHPPYDHPARRARLVAHVFAEIPEIPPEARVPAPLEHVIRTAMAKSAGDRYPSATAMLSALHAAVPGAVMMSGEHLLNAHITTPMPLSGGVDNTAREVSQASEATRASRGAVRPVGPPPIPTRAARSPAVPDERTGRKALPAPELPTLDASNIHVPADPEIVSDEGSADDARARWSPWWIALASVVLVAMSVFVATVLQLTSERSAPGRITPTDITGSRGDLPDPTNRSPVAAFDNGPPPEDRILDALVGGDADTPSEASPFDEDVPDVGAAEVDARLAPIRLERNRHAAAARNADGSGTAHKADTAETLPKKATQDDKPTPRPQPTEPKAVRDRAARSNSAVSTGTALRPGTPESRRPVPIYTDINYRSNTAPGEAR